MGLLKVFLSFTKIGVFLGWLEWAEGARPPPCACRTLVVFGKVYSFTKSMCIVFVFEIFGRTAY